MKKYIHLILIVFLFACEQKDGKQVSSDDSFVENGVVKQYDDQNRLSAEITFKNGVRHGLTRIYYSSGAISDEIMYVEDMRSGFAKKFHKNGQLYSLTPYHEDERQGIQKKYYANGKLWAETPYLRGQPGVGLKEYRKDGSLRSNFPGIEVQKIIKEDRIVLSLFLTNYSKNVVFYVSDFMKEKYIPVVAKPIYAKSGSGRYEIPYARGTALDTTISIIAKYQTQDYNINVSQRKYRIIIK
ncbi:MAG: hypothetical protein JEZ01_00170 [Labilibaculum sp.]|nr:hypothetical protein [Labilibaculum sp.]MBI9056160.1 hypothetical protein [Labilibaculum sp.]